ncbi:ankyrin repeat domain-containing protein [Olivibacter sp. SDN3]|uniref:ankyrin repeat domain-containing protein n=1 Tax=Olivibacter sp. SDN3 TaxID=2764720 RepID=UPI001650E9A7|nr:ankyrin repeat domain-containing protein [Olivibacter sp. SDN3]QNL50942.1 ankyrin repeat domain-containing protein [Olivibacter sp. SDN3]
MKTQEIIVAKTWKVITFLVASFLMTACVGQGDSDQQNGTANKTEKVKPPKIDIHAAVVGGDTEALQQHIAAGTDINKKDPYGGSSPLITAALFDKPAMVETLIEAGADIDFQNKEGSTALITAAFFGRPEIVKILLEKGADKKIKNKFGATAYESAAAPFNEVKSTYDMMGKLLKPMGLELDYKQLEKIRPQIAAMLK